MSLHPRLAAAALSRPPEFSIEDLYEQVSRQPNVEAGDLLPALAAARARPKELASEDMYWLTESLQYAVVDVAVLLWVTELTLEQVATRCALHEQRASEQLGRLRRDWSWIRSGTDWRRALDELGKTWVEADTIPGERMHLVFSDPTGRQAHLMLLRRGGDDWPWLLDAAVCR